MQVKTEIEMLKQTTIFRAVEESYLQLLAFSSIKKKYEKGEAIFDINSATDYGILICDGNVKAIDNRNASQIIEETLSRGSFIHHLGMIAKIKPRLEYYAIDTVTVKVYSHELFQRISHEFPNYTKQIYNNVSYGLDISLNDLNVIKPLFND